VSSYAKRRNKKIRLKKEIDSLKETLEKVSQQEKPFFQKRLKMILDSKLKEMEKISVDNF
tara:strand:- start:16024 stop:16203 length:180 start_codon:yes stop_codon:yes gene_type:complete